MKRKMVVFFLAGVLLLLAACGSTTQAMQAGNTTAASTEQQHSAEETTDGSETVIQADKPDIEKQEEAAMRLKIGSTAVSVAWEQNESVEALKALLTDGPLTIQMSPYGGFEQVGPIGQSIPRNDVQTVTEPGDIVLYSGNQIVVFYGSNSWAYTRLGKMRGLDQAALTELLGNGAVALTLSLEA